MEIEPETDKFNVLNVFQSFSKNGDNLLSLLKNNNQIILFSWNFLNFEKIVNFYRFWANAFDNTTLTLQKRWFTVISKNWSLPKLVKKGVSLSAIVKGKSDSTDISTTRKSINLPIRPSSRGGDPSNLAIYALLWLFETRLKKHFHSFFW